MLARAVIEWSESMPMIAVRRLRKDENGYDDAQNSKCQEDASETESGEPSILG